VVGLLYEERMNQAVCAVFVRDHKILLAKRALHKSSYAGCWDFVGGHVEPGETLTRALVREAEEEVGLTPRRFSLEDRIRDERYDAIYHVFVVDEWRGGEPLKLGDEHTELGWFTVGQACALPDLALPEYRDVLSRLESGS
jgi:8-oxo-dGTP diphosphatase